MVIFIWLHMFRSHDRELQAAPGVQLGGGRESLDAHFLLSFTGYLLPGPAGDLGGDGGTNMARATPLLGNEGPFGPQLGMTPR